MRYLKFVLPFVFLIVLASCQSVQNTHTEYPAVKKGKSLLLVSVGEGLTRPLIVLVNGKTIATLSAGEVVYIHMPPGDHRVRDSSVNSFPLDLMIREGEIAHVRAHYTERGIYFKLSEGWNDFSFDQSAKSIEVNY